MRRLPNNKITKNDALYIKEWRKLAVGVCKLMPHWRLYAFDPNLAFSTPDGRIIYVDIELAEQINANFMLNGCNTTQFRDGLSTIGGVP